MMSGFEMVCHSEGTFVATEESWIIEVEMPRQKRLSMTHLYKKVNMNQIKILFFATIKDRAGTKSMNLDIPAHMTIQQLKEKLSADYPNLKDSLKSVLMTINREYAFNEAIIPLDAEVALFPPVSGG